MIGIFVTKQNLLCMLNMSPMECNFIHSLLQNPILLIAYLLQMSSIVFFSAAVLKEKEKLKVLRISKTLLNLGMGLIQSTF